PIEEQMNPDDRKDLRVQPRFGGDPADVHELAFNVTAVREKRRRITDPPYDAPGGDWTFLEGEPVGKPEVGFTVGVKPKGAAGGGGGGGNWMGRWRASRQCP